MVRKRERLELISDILKSIRDRDNKIRPTKLLSASNLSPQMFKEYSLELQRKEFIEIITDKKNKKLYTLTNKGYKFLEKYSIVLNFIDDFGL
jgi:predicted transcriptional regulator